MLLHGAQMGAGELSPPGPLTLTTGYSPDGPVNKCNLAIHQTATRT